MLLTTSEYNDGQSLAFNSVERRHIKDTFANCNEIPILFEVFCWTVVKQASLLCCYLNLLNKLLWSTFSIFRLFRVPHFKTCKIQNSVMSGQHPCYWSVAISVVHVVESCSQLRSMTVIFIPPVDSGYLFWSRVTSILVSYDGEKYNVFFGDL